MPYSPELIAEELRRQAEPILLAHPDLGHSWVEAGGIVELRFPGSSEGFPIAVVAGYDDLKVLMGHSHQHFGPRPGELKAEVTAVLGLVRDLLSPDTRLREFRSGRSPYRWIVESRSATGWEPESVNGLLFYNYFGRKSEHILQNRQLPGRLTVAG